MKCLFSCVPNNQIKNQQQYVGKNKGYRFNVSNLFVKCSAAIIINSIFLQRGGMLCNDKLLVMIYIDCIQEITNFSRILPNYI